MAKIKDFQEKIYVKLKNFPKTWSQYSAKYQLLMIKSFLASQLVYNGNRTEWSPVRSVIVRVINKTGQPRFVYHEYDYRLNWRQEVMLPIYHYHYNFRKTKKCNLKKIAFNCNFSFIILSKISEIIFMENMFNQ